MRTRAVFFSLGALVLAMPLAAASQRTPPTFPPPPTPRAPTAVQNPQPNFLRWEYRVETRRIWLNQSSSPPNFNSLGSDGWELCGIRESTIEENGFKAQDIEYYFKRPLP